MLCEQCGQMMKLIPAGVSKKTNKPYSAFYSCPQCKATQQTSDRHQALPAPQPSAEPTKEEWGEIGKQKMRTKLAEAYIRQGKRWDEVQVDLVAWEEYILGLDKQPF